MATATKAYTLINLPIDSTGHQNAVQKTYVGTTNIYCLQKFGNDTVISQASIANGQTIIDFSGSPQMRIKNTGHAQTLDWFSHNGSDYFLVAIDGRANDSSSTEEWATQLGRIQFRANSQIDLYTEVTRLSVLNRANKSGNNFGSLLRVEGAISTSHEYLLTVGIRVGDHHAQLAYYDLEGINNVLDSVEASGGHYIECNNSDVQQYCIDDWETPGSLYRAMGVNDGVQGLDFSDGLAVYFTSGNQDETPTVIKVDWKSTDFRGRTCSGDWGNLNLVETEGIQVKDTLYMGITTHALPKNDPNNYTTANYVYTVDKSNW
ncbi:helveticin J family class III bacteriocin [Secundilactobacillus silagei]|uniref:Bacteriocin helveticin J n=1 Tax=Secundilactobacillus silagei JCM 19001 TaxID=1302250 RepID=A0A1Z5IKG8_9LACO|nr:helveticin J family class III bacteriocin [Secundilactobacillus silagei]TDG69934.1 hypothetical protein C5L25_002054 [Secundilactobacillus silagei JCM 19001]GAX02072.1 bacteriocin helveticin J [Secundilactobacillus silagei JCM 19001]